MKYMQSPVKMMPFYSPLNYKSLQPQKEQDKLLQNCCQILKIKI